jgi:hypothetical protein
MFNYLLLANQRYHRRTGEVENMQRQSALAHAFDERADGLLVVSVVNKVVSHRPKDHGGGKAGLPVSDRILEGPTFDREADFSTRILSRPQTTLSQAG